MGLCKPKKKKNKNKKKRRLFILSGFTMKGSKESIITEIFIIGGIAVPVAYLMLRDAFNGLHQQASEIFNYQETAQTEEINPPDAEPLGCSGPCSALFLLGGSAGVAFAFNRFKRRYGLR